MGSGEVHSPFVRIAQHTGQEAFWKNTALWQGWRAQLWCSAPQPSEMGNWARIPVCLCSCWNQVCRLLCLREPSWDSKLLLQGKCCYQLGSVFSGKWQTAIRQEQCLAEWSSGGQQGPGSPRNTANSLWITWLFLLSIGIQDPWTLLRVANWCHWAAFISASTPSFLRYPDASAPPHPSQWEPREVRSKLYFY